MCTRSIRQVLEQKSAKILYVSFAFIIILLDIDIIDVNAFTSSFTTLSPSAVSNARSSVHAAW